MFVKSIPKEERNTTDLFADIESYSRTQQNDEYLQAMMIQEINDGNCSICLISV